MSQSATSVSRGGARRRLLGALLGAAVSPPCRLRRLRRSCRRRRPIRASASRRGWRARASPPRASSTWPTGRSRPPSTARTRTSPSRARPRSSGNYNGINIYDISNPAAPVLKTSLSCPGSQNDVSVWGNLLFVSVESTRPRRTARPRRRRRRRRASAASASSTSPTSRRRSRSTRSRPAAARTRTRWCVRRTTRRTSTSTFPARRRREPRPSSPAVTATTDAPTGENPSKWRIEVIKVPLAAPRRPRSSTRRGCSRTSAGARQRPPERGADAAAPVRDAAVRSGHERVHGRQTWSPTPITDACHDITVYEAFDLAAGACEGNGLLIDISDRPTRCASTRSPIRCSRTGTAPRSPTTARRSSSPTSGAAATAARCRATDQLSWGADAIYEIVDRKLVFRSYYKLPVAQSVTENCVSHVGNLIPIPGGTSWPRPGIRAACR